MSILKKKKFLLSPWLRLHLQISSPQENAVLKGMSLMKEDHKQNL